MLKQRFYIEGVEVTEPNNYAANEIELNFDKGETNAQLSVESYEMGVGDSGNPSDGERVARARLTNGTTGGLGVTEGLPFKIDLDTGGVPVTILDGYLDLWRAKYECGKITAQAVEQGKIDWLKSGRVEFSFEYLAEIGFITEADYVMVPYVINRAPATYEAVMGTITIFVIVGEITGQIQQILEMTAEAANPFEASVIARMVLRIIYIATLLLALIKLCIDVFNMLIQPVKYHAGMYIVDLIRIGCAYLGYTFASSYWQTYPYNKIYLLPHKFKTADNTDGIFAVVDGLLSPNKTSQKGYPGQGYTFGDLLQMIQTDYHSKIIVDGTTLRIEKQNYNLSVPSYVVPPIETTEFELNESDFFSNFLIKYQTDLNDKNTIKEYTGTSYQVQIAPISYANQKMILTKRLQTININFALGKRKTELSFVEKIFNAFFKTIGAIIDALVEVINAIIKVINRVIKLLNKIIRALDKIGIDIDFEIKPVRELEPPGFGDLIEDRIGMLKMENDYVYVPKLLMIDNNSDPRNNKLLPDNESVLSAKHLWDNFHFYKSFVPQTGNENGNQYYIYPLPKIPFTYSDFLTVRANNKIIDSDGNVGVIDSLKWNIDEQTATGQYRINRTYTTNLQETKFEPNGI